MAKGVPRAGAIFLNAHPEYHHLFPHQLVKQIKQPQLSLRTWTRARHDLGLCPQTGAYQYALVYLKEHPELHTLPVRTIEAQVKTRHINYHVWSKAKRALGITGRAKRKQPSLARAAVVETRTYTVSGTFPKAEITVKATDGTEEFHRVHFETAKVLMYALLVKTYQARKTVPGTVVFTKTERLYI